MFRRILSLSAAAIVAIAMVACGGDSDTERLDASDWAVRVCDTANSVAEAMVSDGVDSTELSVDARKERSQEMIGSWVPALESAADEMRAFQGPEDTDAYHDALTAQYDELASAAAEAEEKIADASDANGIESANADMSITFSETGEAIDDAAAELDDRSQAALRGVQGCSLVQ